MAFRRSRVRIPSAPPEQRREERKSRDLRSFSFGRKTLNAATVLLPGQNPFVIIQGQSGSVACLVVLVFATGIAASDHSTSYAAKQLGAESLARTRTAPENVFLAIDLVVVEHPGSNIQGVDMVYASGAKRSVLAHAFVAGALVYANKPHDPIPCRSEENSSHVFLG